MQDLLKQFEDHLKADGKSTRTVESYVGDVQEFLIHLEHAGPVDLLNVKRQHVTTFLAHLKQRELKPNTMNKKVNSLSCLCLWLKEQGLMDERENPVVPRKDRVKVASGSEKEVTVFSDEEVAKLLNHIHSKKVSLRNKLLIYMLLYTGARVSEIVGTKIKDIDTITQELTIVGKGQKLRTVPLRQDLLDVIKEYIRTERQNNPHKESQYLLLSQRAPKMHRDAVNTILEQMSKELNFKCHPHQFRHHFCSSLVKTNKVPLTTIAKLAGHASVATVTKFYIATSKEDKLNAVNLL